MLKHSLLLTTLLFSLTFSNAMAEGCMDDALKCSSEESSSDLLGFDDDVSDANTDELSGFGDDEEIQSEDEEDIQSVEIKSELFTLSGDVAFKTSAGMKNHKVDGVDYSGINQAQTSLFLQIDSKLSDDWKLRVSGDVFYDAIYDLHPDNKYSDDIKDAYKTQARFDDTYIQGRLNSNLDLKVGRQIVVWGKSDSIRVTDVINPLDNRLPGMTDIEDLRLSVGMAKLDYYVGAWNLSAMAIAENRIMLEAPARSEFFNIEGLLQNPNAQLPELITPENSTQNMQYALGANGVFSGWDLSFYAANVLDQKWHINQANGTREVSSVKMLGSAINIATGSWLVKSEIAYLDGIKYNSTVDDKNRVDALVGFDYMGIKDTVLSLEIANRHIFDYKAQMLEGMDFVEEDEMQTAMRATRSFSNDTINATALLSMFGTSFENGGFARVWMEYDIMDALSANIGFVDYISGDKPIIKVNKDNDRVFADVTYSF